MTFDCGHGMASLFVRLYILLFLLSIGHGVVLMADSGLHWRFI